MRQNFSASIIINGRQQNIDENGYVFLGNLENVDEFTVMLTNKHKLYYYHVDIIINDLSLGTFSVPKNQSITIKKPIKYIHKFEPTIKLNVYYSDMSIRISKIIILIFNTTLTLMWIMFFYKYFL